MIVVAGESLIDFIERPGDGPNPVFEAFPGGSPYNCALALGRLGARAGFLGPFSNDRLGALMRARLESTGARALVGQPNERPTSLAVVSIGAGGHATYQFYRAGTADRDIEVDRMLALVPDGARVFQTGSLALHGAPDGDVWRDIAGRLRARGVLVSLDPNLRPRLVEDWTTYRERLDGFFDIAALVKISDEDLEHLGIDADAASLKVRFLDRHGCALVVVTRGPEGALLVAREAVAEIPAWRPPVVIDTVGAGDTFMAALLVRLGDRGRLTEDGLARLRRDDLEDVGRFAAVAAGLNCAMRGCDPPGRQAVLDALA